MKIARLWLPASLLTAAVVAQDMSIDKETLRGVALVAAIGGQFGGTPTFGAGIVFAREKDRLYIATARHVVRQRGSEALNLRVKLANWPEKLLPAKLLPQDDAALDVAVLTVDNLIANGIDPCALSLDRLAPPAAAKRGAAVIPIGNPNNEPWTVPLRPDAVLEERGDQVIFESARVARGHSGGALLSTGGQLIGMIQADEPPNGRALKMERLIQILQSWNLPVHLRMRAWDGVTPLFAAVRRNDVDDARNLLRQACTNVNSLSESASRLRVLNEAAAEGGAAMIDLIFHAGAEVNQRTGRSPLEVAAEHGNVETARALIALGAEVNRNTDGTALVSAAESGHLEAVKLLLANGANPNLASSRYPKSPPLIAAIRSPGKGNLEVLHALIQAGADVNWKDEAGDTPLMDSIRFHGDFAEPALILLEAGADAAVKNLKGESAIHLVSQYFHYSSVQQIAAAILRANSPIGPEDAAQLLDRSAREGWPDLAALVVQHGFKVSGLAGVQMLGVAAGAGHPDVMRVLIEAGADANVDTLYLALTASKTDPAARFEIVQLLVSKGAKVNTTDRYRQPIWEAVVVLRDARIANFLLAHGADISAAIEYGRSRGKPDAVELLLKARQAAPPPRK